MRIAQVAPLHESVPPRLYGGTERVVSYLTEELVARGHDVTLFASGDSRTGARLVPGCPRSLRLDESCRDPIAHHLVLMERVLRELPRFEIVHWHIDYLHFPLSSREPVRHVTTLHGRLDLPDLAPLYREFPNVPVVSISDAQRRPLPWLDWRATVHHGVRETLHAPGEGKGGYLAFLGRISPEKGVDHAIEIARRSGIELKIAAKVDRLDRDYFKQRIEPLLDPAVTEYLGEITEHEKEAFLGDARALLFPIDWPEPFGMVLIEAMACATPVIAYPRGSVPELVRDGETGFLVTSVDEAVQALDRLPQLSRRRCREVFERRFTAARMARDYEAVYAALGAATSRRPLAATAGVEALGRGKGRRRRTDPIRRPGGTPARSA